MNAPHTLQKNFNRLSELIGLDMGLLSGSCLFQQRFLLFIILLDEK